MSDTVFLVNPASGNGATARRWPRIRQGAAEAGIDGEPFFSESPGHIRLLAHRAARNGARLLVVVGGDGTVHEAVNGLLAAGLPATATLALLPQGTGDDFARAFEIPHALDEALAVAASGPVKTLDVGRVTYSADGRTAEAFFASMAGVGMSGAVAAKLNATTKALGGRIAGLLATLTVFSRWSNVQLDVQVDEEHRRGLMEDVLVANTAFHNGGMRLCPDARPDDGIFDVLLIGDVSKKDLALVLPKLYRGTHLPHPKAELLRGRTVSVDAPTALPVELDGEQPGTTPVRFECVPGAFGLKVPR